MFVMYEKLIRQIIATNIEFICYLVMIWAMLLYPGILTVVYPLSVFGYALLEPDSPR